MTLYTKWDIILFALEQYKFVFYALKGGGTKVEKDCGAWINLLSHMVKARLDTTLQDLDITGMQSRVIYYILVHFQEGPVFQRDIESAFGLSRSTATGILQQLEKKDIIQRESVARDARLKSLVPTQHAVELNAKVDACFRETDRLLTRGLSDGQVQLFKEIAAQMFRNLENWNSGEAGPTAGSVADKARAHWKSKKFAAEQKRIVSAANSNSETCREKEEYHQ